MSDQNTSIAVQDETVHGKSGAALGVVKKTAPKRPSKAKKSKPVDKDVNTTQTWILKILSKSKGPLTRREIAEKVEKAGGSTSRSRVSDECGNYGSLVKRKFVSEQVIGDNGAADDHKQTVYAIMASGRKALEAAK